MTTKPLQETPLAPGGRGLRPSDADWSSDVPRPPVTDRRGAGTAKLPRESRFIELTRWILIPVLVVAGMLLPPFSLGSRLLQGEWTLIGEGRMPVWSVNDPDGAQVTVPEQPLDGKLRLRLSSVPRLHFLAGQVDEYLLPAVTALPFNLAVRSPFYEVQCRGVSPSDAVLTLPIPNDAEPYATLDLYAWDGNAWKWLPSTVIQADDVIVARLEMLPEMMIFAVVQPLPPEPVVAASLSDSAMLPEDGAQVLNEIYSMGATLSDNGTLELPAEPLAPGEGTWRALPVVRNWGDDGTVRSDLTDEVLGSQVLRQKHIAAILAFARTEEHRGMVLDYRDVNPALRESFTSFVRDLAEQLHAGGRTLVVRVAWPTQISAVDWNTGAYDWRALGKVADVVLLTGPLDPHAYVEDGPVEQGIAWATRYIDRYKLQLVVGARGVNQSEEGVVPISYGAALAFLSHIAIDTVGESVSPGDEISLSLTNLSDSPGIQFDVSLQTYWFSYADDRGSAHTVWLENKTSLTHKLQLVARHRLRGVMVEHLAEPMSDPALWTAVRAYSHGELQSQETTFVVVWEVSNATGRPLAQATRSLDDAGVVWQAPKTPGIYEYSAVIVANGQPVAEKEVAVVQVVAYTPTPTSTPTSTPTPTPTPTGTPTPTPTAAPTTTPRPTATPTPTSSPVASAASVVPASGYGFGYGIQAHAIGQDLGPIFDHIRQLGFQWLKVQVEWKNHEGPKGQYAWADIDRLVEHAQLNGIKLLLSVVKAPAWSRPAGTDLGVEGPPANPQDYADFVGAMAARYRGRVQAYEIWNEQNLYYEWGREPLDASRYVKLLKLAYQASRLRTPRRSSCLGH